ncbi:MAG: response regulator transcription factor [Cyanobacteria bacterium SZAS TMP-1]|nr:response regulator transcription factor [Cyanobacteria bacterium SZAS TMP-1]
MAKVLIVEDDIELARSVERYLKGQGYNVDMVHDGNEAASYLRSYSYDLLLLDWQLPGRPGVEILQELRSRGLTTPTIMVTGLNSLDHKERGLDSGADDYITKPYEMRELLARVRSVLRRSQGQASADSISAGPITLDCKSRRVSVNGAAVELLPKEFQLLQFLMLHQNEVFSPTALLDRVWPTDSEATAEAIRSTYKRLRKKVDPEGTVLKTVYGVGYIVEA